MPNLQSCISEEQKYQGALYKEKSSKEEKKKVKIADSTARKSRKAYVEDAEDADTGKHAITIVDPPPPAPDPPVSTTEKAEPINVFDFLVTGDTPNASTTSLVPKEGMKMVKNAPSIFGEVHHPKEKGDGDSLYENHGFTYGSEPVPVKKDEQEIEYFTPAPKHQRKPSAEAIYGLENPERKSTDKKRKRLHVEELDLTEARRPSVEADIIMVEAPSAPILHSGLTGGLNRLLSKSKFPPSPEYSNGDPSPPSPVKRPKQIVAKEKDRGRKSGITRTASGQLVRVRKRRTSDESRPRKQHRSEHHGHSEHPKQKAIEHPKRKAIEYHPQTRQDDTQQLIVYKSRAELFMSFVTKGPESEQGYSMHKALKRYHRERGEQGLGLEKVDEEKELFKGLRLRRNDRGEVVVFF